MAHRGTGPSSLRPCQGHAVVGGRASSALGQADTTHTIPELWATHFCPRPTPGTAHPPGAAWEADT